MAGVDPRAQLDERLLGRFGDLSQHVVLQSRQAQRHMVTLRTSTGLAKLLAARPRARYIRRANAKTHGDVNHSPRRLQNPVT